MFKNKRNYFLIASILIAICAVGLLIAQTTNQRLDNKIQIAQAQKDCLDIAKALLHFYKDTGTFPYYCSPWQFRTEKPEVDYLYGNMGEFPFFADGLYSSWGNIGEDLYFSLVTNGDRGEWYKPKLENSGFINTPYPLVGWDGPYLKSIADPWGFKYMVSISGFGPLSTMPANSVWCLSSGPNHIVDTPAWSTDVVGDDIGYCVESEVELMPMTEANSN
jgi:hypothetical protein